jgi:hypothetical protein
MDWIPVGTAKPISGKQVDVLLLGSVPFVGQYVAKTKEWRSAVKTYDRAFTTKLTNVTHWKVR